MWGSLCAGSFLLGHESGHSIARPTACGSRVPPQRTVLGETPAHAGEVAIRQLLGRYGLRTVERLCALCAALQPQNAPACALAAQRARQLEADGNEKPALLAAAQKIIAS